MEINTKALFLELGWSFLISMAIAMVIISILEWLKIINIKKPRIFWAYSLGGGTLLWVIYWGVVCN
jgi:hypothetical protein